MVGVQVVPVPIPCPHMYTAQVAAERGGKERGEKRKREEREELGKNQNQNHPIFRKHLETQAGYSACPK